MQAVIFSRISCNEQADGYSLAAQNARLIEYCKRNHLEVIKSYQIIESSTRGKRKEFTEMIRFCKDQPELIAIVCDSVDRLQRSFRECCLVEDLIKQEKIELHFFRETMVIGKNASATDILRWQFFIMGASAYILQMSENLKRSLMYKVNNGQVIGPAACGYENFVQTDGKHSVRKKEPEATYLKRLFELYSIGGTSIHQLTKMADEYGIKTRTGKKIGVTSMIHIIDNPFYYGEMLVKGKLYRHIYEPLITKELYDKCQEQRRLQSSKVFKHGEIPFVYRGVFTDYYNKNKTCSCEIKKKKFIYVVCYNEIGRRIYIPEQIINRQVEAILDEVAISEQTIFDFKEYIKSSKQAELDYKKSELERIDAKLNKIDQRIISLFNMRLDQEITKDEYEIKSNEYKLERSRLELQKKSHQIVDDGFNEAVLNMFDLLTSAKSIFKSTSDIKSKQLLLHFIFKKLELKEGIINYKLKSPFCYTKMDDFMPNMYYVSSKSVENCEPIENKRLNGVLGGISASVENAHCEPRESLENKGLLMCSESPVQYGWQEDAEIKEKSAQLYNVLVNHYNEILAMKDQVKLIKSLLDA